ncbi:hypothetical protein OsI_14594 [Oryza sativa Indica Group]|uniref:Uncharacterized protein n=1 Tax=Oryza sativa subsp. indica TaxID=39946 RepID=B8AU96_ORYSI|nr:hypothetical protein OsI_14594 [Oryza sativa Indica Group]
MTPLQEDILPVDTIVQSSLIKHRALSTIAAAPASSSSSAGGEEMPPAASAAVVFLCIAKEAELMLELLKHGATDTDDIIQQSSVIRLCAMSLFHLQGCQSLVAAGAMLGVAKEAKMLCDWMKKENKLVIFSKSLSLPCCELEESRLIRIRALDVMMTILQQSSFPSSKDKVRSPRSEDTPKTKRRCSEKSA